MNFKKLAWPIFTVGILYYCFAYLLRVYPSVMEPELLSHFGITASSFGILTSFYYFAYAPMQLPVGMTVDFIGVRRSLLSACLISCIGALIFANTNHFGFSLFGRFLIGFGTAFAYVSALKIASLHLPKKYFATAAGAVTGSGMIAAIFTDMYLTHIVQTSGFKHALFFPLIIGIVLFLLIFLFIREKNEVSEHHHETKSAISAKELLRYIKIIVKNPQMWYISIVGALLYLPATVFVDVWGIPYLRASHGLTPELAALGVSTMLTGWILSSFITGGLSDYFGNRKLFLFSSSIGACLISAAILYLPAVSNEALFTLLFLLGICCGPHPLCFTMSKENNDGKMAGTAVSFANFIIMMGGFIFQPAVGRLLDHYWQGNLDHGVRLYSPHNYTMALSILPIGLFIAALIIVKIKETYAAPVTSTMSETANTSTGINNLDDPVGIAQ